MLKLRNYVMGLACAILTASSFAASFSASSGQEPLKFPAEDILHFAKKVEKELGKSGARVAIVSRMGRPLSEMPPNMHYTHVAFAVYSMITDANGNKAPGYVMYNLYQQAKRPERSDLVTDYPVDFFAGVSSLESGVLIPSPNLQARLLEVITSPTYKKMHQPNYSVIANPYNTSKQNCTEFVLDVVNSAIYKTDDINLIKAQTKNFFKAQPVDVNPLKLMFGSMFSAEVSTADQSSGTPLTATFERISDYLLRYDEGSRLLNVSP